MERTVWMSMEADFRQAAEKYSRVWLIVSPPRCCSTTLARVFWEHPAIRYYSHEPFDAVYHKGRALDEATAKLEHPIDVTTVARNETLPESHDLTLKEMTFQVRDHFPLLMSVTAEPVVFLTRDPRWSIASRLKKIRQAGKSSFPPVESGWNDLRDQVAWCKAEGKPHMILDATDFRRRPSAVLGELFARLGLEFSDELLEWRPCGALRLDNLDGEQSHFYDRVLESTGIKAPLKEFPDLDFFPAGEMREHVIESLEIYEELMASPARIGG